MEHKWVEQPLDTASSKEIKLPPGTKLPGGGVSKEGDVFVLNFKMHTQVKSLRVCSVCGQESVDGEDPKDSCDIKQVRDVLES